MLGRGVQTSCDPVWSEQAWCTSGCTWTRASSARGTKRRSSTSPQSGTPTAPSSPRCGPRYLLDGGSWSDLRPVDRAAARRPRAHGGRREEPLRYALRGQPGLPLSVQCLPCAFCVWLLDFGWALTARLCACPRCARPGRSGGRGRTRRRRCGTRPHPSPSRPPWRSASTTRTAPRPSTRSTPSHALEVSTRTEALYQVHLTPSHALPGPSSSNL